MTSFSTNLKNNNNPTFDVIVIGAGPAGIIAAGRAAERGLKTLLVEKNSQPGKKLLITGKGRCNITNSGNIKEFVTSFGKNGSFLYQSFHSFFNNDLISFFERYKVRLKTERGGRLFPASDESKDIVQALAQHLANSKVNVLYNHVVSEVITDKTQVTGIKLISGKTINASCVIVATGGCSYPRTGSTGDGYRMAKETGHTVTKIFPALVPLETNDATIKQLQGLSLKNVQATLYSNGKKIRSEFGEMIFTHFGVSGPIILTLSGDAAEQLASGNALELSIDFKPALEDTTLEQRLLRELDAGKKTLKTILKTLLPIRLCDFFIEQLSILPDKKASHITKDERNSIKNLLTDLRFPITKTRPIDEAIVTRGGIALKELNPKTMESKIVTGLFFCGEVLDLDGITGGYNLQAAFSTGYCAGEGVNK